MQILVTHLMYIVARFCKILLYKSVYFMIYVLLLLHLLPSCALLWHAYRGRGEIGPLAGQLTLDCFSLKRHFSFLDYLRGGLELQLMVAVDLTRSNLGQTNPKSMQPGYRNPEKMDENNG